MIKHQTLGDQFLQAEQHQNQDIVHRRLFTIDTCFYLVAMMEFDI